MPLPIPILDDLEWSELLEEARDRIPATAASWTDHNVHDPGVTILELLAWVAEQLSYRIDQIPDHYRQQFLSLLGVTRTADETTEEALSRAARTLAAHEQLVALATNAGAASLDDLDRNTVLETEVPPRATTLLDIERIAFATPNVDLARVRAWPNLDLNLPCYPAPGTVSVTVVSFEPTDEPQSERSVLDAVSAHLNQRRTVGTRIRVFGPTYSSIRVATSVTLDPGSSSARTLAAVDSAIRQFLHPLTGGPRGTGWPFGRDVYRSELLSVIGSVAGVDLPTVLRIEATDQAHTVPAASCSNLCIPAANLVSLDAVQVELDASQSGSKQTSGGCHG